MRFQLHCNLARLVRIWWVSYSLEPAPDMSFILSLPNKYALHVSECLSRVRMSPSMSER